MGIDLWFYSRFVSQRAPILKVKVLNSKSIKVTCFAAEKSGFRFTLIWNSGLKSLNDAPGCSFGAEGIKFGSNMQLSKLILKA